jgi:hypothetical protein
MASDLKQKYREQIYGENEIQNRQKPLKKDHQVASNDYFRRNVGEDKEPCPSTRDYERDGTFDDAPYNNGNTSDTVSELHSKTDTHSEFEGAGSVGGNDGTGGGRYSFQHRLWRVLFSNVNRNIDELYYLCEEQGDEEVRRRNLMLLLILFST